MDNIRIEMLLQEVINQRASDLHLQAGLPPILRIDGSLTPMAGVVKLSPDMVEKLVFSVLDNDQQQIFIKDKEFDFSFAFG